MQIHLDNKVDTRVLQGAPREGVQTKVTTIGGRKLTLLAPGAGDDSTALMDPAADDSISVQQQRVALLSQLVQQQEATAAKTIAQFIPDFEGSPALTRFLNSVRRLRASGNFQAFAEEVETHFQEETMKHAAATAVVSILEQESQGKSDDDSSGESNQQNTAFRKVIDEYLLRLEAESGRQIRAGYNISKVVERFSDGGRKVMPIMRQFYWKVLCEFTNPFDCYMFIMESFPESHSHGEKESDPYGKGGHSRHGGSGYGSEEEEDQSDPNRPGSRSKKLPPAEGIAGLQRLQKAQHFLSEAIGAELAPRPPKASSLEPARLKLLLDGIFQISFLVNSYKDSDELLRKFNQQYSKSICICPHKLLSETLQQLKSEYVNYSILIKLMEELNIPEGVSRISFFTQFYGIISKMPMKVYQNEDHWQRVDKAMKEALDEIIDKEDTET